jgi:hypothetical protein
MAAASSLEVSQARAPKQSAALIRNVSPTQAATRFMCLTIELRCARQASP